MPNRYAITLILFAFILIIAAPATAAVPPGRIAVYSTPSGADVCIDNDDCDMTPATFSVEGNAWHMIVVKEKGYRDWTEVVYVTSDLTSTATAYLDLDPDATGVEVNITPGGGTVCLDNLQCRESVGLVTGNGSTLFTGVSAGYHTVSVESPPGYEDTTQLVEVKLGKITGIVMTLATVTATPTPTLTPLPETGMVRVYVDRTGSTICLDNTRCAYNVGGDSTAGTGTMVFDRVSANQTHIVTVALDGYEPYSSPVQVSKDLISTVDVTLRPMGGAARRDITTVTTTVATTPPVTVSAPATAPPTMPTARSDPGPVMALCALVLTGVVALLMKNR